MTKPARPRPLTDTEVAMARLIARGMSNAEIATELGMTLAAVEGRLGTLYSATGARSATGRPDALSRVRIVVWAFENGLMDGVPAAAPPALNSPLIAALLDMCEAIVADRPRGDLRKLAGEALRAAGRLPRPNQLRVKPAPRA